MNGVTYLDSTNGYNSEMVVALAAAFFLLR
jgi:hypothetical protein